MSFESQRILILTKSFTLLAQIVKTITIDRRNIDGIVTQTGCMGYCYAEPTVEITLPGQDPVVYGEVDEKKADEIIEKYIKNGELVDGIIPVNYETIESKDQKEE